MRADVPLRRNTKDINLSVRFINPDDSPCEEASHLYTPAILCYDGILSFDNSLHPDVSGFYCLTSGLKNHKGGNLDALFHKMTLRLGQQAEIILASPAASRRPAKVVYRESLLKLLAGTGFSTQDALDRTQSFDVLLQFTCDCSSSGTALTVRIWVNGWEYIDISGGV